MVKNLKRMLILSGPAGSGKSTLCQKFVEEAKSQGMNVTVHSTDNFWMKNGKYVFDRQRLGIAHGWNQSQAEKSCLDEVDVIIIDNTNLTWKEVLPYARLAKDNGYQVEIHIPDNAFYLTAEELAKRNTHGVPLESIRAMVNRWDRDMSRQLAHYMESGDKT